MKSRVEVMENQKGIGVGDGDGDGEGEIHFPLEIIHQIQSFLKERDAAETSLVSKWWYSAWSTRPNLAFELGFNQRGTEFARKTIWRYEDENLRIQSLKVTTPVNPYRNNGDRLVARRFIAKAMKLGAADLDISFWNRWFVLPDVVLETKTLTSLCLSGFTLNIPPMKEGISFPKLRSLDLNNLIVNGDLVGDLISRCPSIETLMLHRIRSCYEDEELQLGKIEVVHLGSSLKLQGLFFRSHESLAMFSCLKQLEVVWGDNGTEDVRICSRSLQRICILLNSGKRLSAEFDVPNLRKFELRGGSPSSRLDFKSSREWESEIRLYCSKSDEIITPSWFSSLNQLLRMLRDSRVFVSIDGDGDGDGDADASVRAKESGGDVVVFESLRLDGGAANSDFLDNLFSFCRPKSIVQGYLRLRCDYPWKEELSTADIEEMADQNMDVKPLEERFGKYSSLSWTRISPAYVSYELRWNLNH